MFLSKTKFGIVVVIATLLPQMCLSNLNINDLPPLSVNKTLEQHSDIFGTPTITKVTNNVYVAVGYALANMIMLEGTDGIVLVDVTEAGRAALKAYEDFRKITSKPLKAIILTHNHRDHIGGVSALLNATKDSGIDVQVYAHSTLLKQFDKYTNTYEIGGNRAAGQFGFFLNDIERENAGIGPKIVLPSPKEYDVNPTITFEDKAEYTVAGITFVLIHTPGETSDQITVWVPKWRVVMPADNIYEAFPNLYAIRGSAPRSCEDWYKSLDKVRHLGAKYMVPSHTQPLKGKKNIYDVITHYRDAIQFVHDQTIRYMNLGVDLDEIAELVRLPPSLFSHPYLQEYYGKVSWSVRSVYNGMLGWFNGDVVNLNQLPKKKRIEKLQELLTFNYENELSANGKMIRHAQECLSKSNKHFNSTGYHLNDELQWALELSTNVLKAKDLSLSDYNEAKFITMSSMISLASVTVNANARNYYLMASKQLLLSQPGQHLNINRRPLISQLMPILKIPDIMDKLPLMFRADQCDDNITTTILFKISDINQDFSFTIRHCVLEYTTEQSYFPKKFDARVSLMSVALRSILTKKVTSQDLQSNEAIKIDGSMESVERFFYLQMLTAFD